MSDFWLSFGIWFCKNLGWHGKIKTGGFDGASIHGVCQRCGKEGMFDSQGNFF